MKKLNITKEQFEKSRYFKDKYGELEYVSESGKVFKTNKGRILMFKEYVDSGAPLPKRRSDGACDNLKPGEYGLSKEWVEGIGTRYVIYKGGSRPGQMFNIKTFGARQKDRAEEVLMGLQDGSIQEKNLSYVHETSKKFGRKFDESDELASILANLIRQASPEEQERIIRMLERDADGTDAGKSAGERVRDSYRDDL